MTTGYPRPAGHVAASDGSGGMTVLESKAEKATGDDIAAPDSREPLALLFRDLRTDAKGLSEREAARRLVAAGPNALSRRRGWIWPGEIARQLVHPLALLLWLAAVLAAVSGSIVLSAAIVVVVLLNAAVAFIQENHAERAVEALAAFLPPMATVLRDGTERQVDVRSIVPETSWRSARATGSRLTAGCWTGTSRSTCRC